MYPSFRFLVYMLCVLNLMKVKVISEQVQAQSLYTCCPFASQYFDLEQGTCLRLNSSSGANASDKNDQDHGQIQFPATFKVPKFLSMSAYSESLAQRVSFRLSRGSRPQECSADRLIVTTSLTETEAEPSLETEHQQNQHRINFTVEGYLKYGNNYFAPNEYCINLLNETAEVSVVICSANLNCSLSKIVDGSSSMNPRNPCIRRCCQFGEVYDLSGLETNGRIECKPSGEHQWMPTFYDTDPYTPLSDETQVQVLPHIISSHPREGWCDPTYATIVSLSKKYKGQQEIIRILKDGTFMHKLQAKTWQKLHKEDMCIDGAQGYPNTLNSSESWSVFYTGDPRDTLLLNCSSPYEDPPGNAVARTLYGISMIISSIFLFLTILVYFLLWEKQNIHGWTILCYALSLFFMYIFLALMHFSDKIGIAQGSFGQGQGGGGGDIGCHIIAVSIHFTFISTFCWLTMINFDLWWTFKVLKPTSGKSKGLKRFIIYALFALGIPIIIVSVGLSLDFKYRGDIESDVIIPLYAQTRCYMDPGKPMLVYVYGPIGVLLGINLILFVFTIISMYRIQQSTKFASASSSKNAKQKQSVKLFLKLFIIMGVTWIFEVISWSISGNTFVWYWSVFDMFNIFQSILIFIIFVCKKEIISSLEQKYPSFKNLTNLVRIESSTFDRVTTRFPRLKGILTPFRKKDETKRSQMSTSHPTDMTSTAESECSRGGTSVKGQKFEMKEKK